MKKKFYRPKELVEMGLFKSLPALYQAMHRGLSPNFTKLSNLKIIFYKQDVNRWINSKKSQEKVKLNEKIRKKYQESGDKRITIRIPKIIYEKLENIRKKGPGFVSQNRIILKSLQLFLFNYDDEKYDHMI